MNIMRPLLLLITLVTFTLCNSTSKEQLQETNSFQITITTNYYWCLFLALSLSLYASLIAANIGIARSKLFNIDFLEKNFGEEHRAAFGPNSSLTKGGYPDQGDGRYSKKLSFEDWFFFNSVQRSHQNT